MSEPYSKYKTSGYLVLNLFKSYYPTSLTSDELAKRLSSSPYIIGILGQYYELSLDGDTTRLEKAMRDLAARASDIPKADSFFDAMKAQADSDFIYTVKYAVRESAKEIGQAAVDITSPLAFIIKNFWIFAGLGAAAYVYIKSRK